MQLSYKLLRAGMAVYGSALVSRIVFTDAGPIMVGENHWCANPEVGVVQQRFIAICIFFLLSSTVHSLESFTNSETYNMIASQN
eukprot:UN28290